MPGGSLTARALWLYQRNEKFRVFAVWLDAIL